MLRNKEIMIGNWFIVGRGTDWEKNVQVDEIFECNSVGLRGRDSTTYLSSLEPIYISLEFIEKNGFEKDCIFEDKDKDYRAYHKQIDECFVQIRVWDDDEIRDLQIDDSHHMCLGGCSIKYVHQMQNFLNILGVDSTFIV